MCGRSRRALPPFSVLLLVGAAASGCAIPTTADDEPAPGASGKGEEVGGSYVVTRKFLRVTDEGKTVVLKGADVWLSSDIEQIVTTDEDGSVELKVQGFGSGGEVLVEVSSEEGAAKWLSCGEASFATRDAELVVYPDLVEGTIRCGPDPRSNLSVEVTLEVQASFSRLWLYVTPMDGATVHPDRQYHSLGGATSVGFRVPWVFAPYYVDGRYELLLDMIWGGSSNRVLCDIPISPYAAPGAPDVEANLRVHEDGGYYKCDAVLTRERSESAEAAK